MTNIIDFQAYKDTKTSNTDKTVNTSKVDTSTHIETKEPFMSRVVGYVLVVPFAIFCKLFARKGGAWNP